AGQRGWAVNSDFFIANMLPAFSFLTLPLFTALLMGDPVIRDFRTGVAPLLLAAPVSRGEYLLGKFAGNFFVLVCCQAAFPLTLCLLQAFRRSDMIVQPVRVWPYLKHFLFLVVISHLALAAVYFAVGTLTRNVKMVYALGASFYPLYIAYQIFLLKRLPARWAVAFDPLLMNWGGGLARSGSADWLNQLAVAYGADVLANRVLMVLATAACLGILYLRFSAGERVEATGRSRTLGLDLPASGSGVAVVSAFQPQARVGKTAPDDSLIGLRTPRAHSAGGFVAAFNQLAAATGVELRLLRAERSLVVILPLAVLLSTMEVAFWKVMPDVSYSAAYAGRTANSLLLFLLVVAIFYTGEAMHRDRELRVEPMLWSAPIPDQTLLLSKFLASLLLTLMLVATVATVAIGLQIYKAEGPVELSAYLTAYAVILLPGGMLLISVAVALNVLLRDKHLTYAASIAAGGGLFYLYNRGYTHWLYNPLLYKLWTPADLLAGGGSHTRILVYRVYCLALTVICLSLAHLFFGRTSAKDSQVRSRLSRKRWVVFVMLVATTAAVMCGWVIDAGS
ncbi:MAG TPA: ABC transporter permease, partial [Blastocatellia bacterium]|nr:ABC transporter permease [Blastocatellia bacterium]